MRTLDQVDLYFKAGNSDKEYHLQLIEDDGTYRVDFQYGRRGGTLNTGTKISTSLMADARKTYDKIYGEKYGKGYRPSDSAIPTRYVNTSTPLKATAKAEPSKSRRILWDNPENSGKATTTTTEISCLSIPQLCNPIEEEDVERYLRDDNWGMQEKKDGKHLMIHVGTDSEVSATNKKGKECGFPESYVSSFNQSRQGCFDGETIGTMFHAFDLLEYDGEDLRGLKYKERFNRLNSLSDRVFGDGYNSVRVVPLAVGYKAKKALYDRLVAEKREGVVFKRLDATFKAGRPASGGDMVKFKFYAECSVRVKEGRKGKRSVGLEIINNDGNWIDIGNVTIPPNKDVPGIGDIVEIKYLYVAFVGGNLYQPVYKEVRDDIDPSECTVKQLKYKPNEED